MEDDQKLSLKDVKIFIRKKLQENKITLEEEITLEKAAEFLFKIIANNSRVTKISLDEDFTTKYYMGALKTLRRIGLTILYKKRTKIPNARGHTTLYELEDPDKVRSAIIKYKCTEEKIES